MSTSRSYHHGDLRTALLDTTRAVLADVGIEGLSLREVSRQAGVSHAAAYNHFADKAGLVRAVVDAAFARMAADMRAARSGASDPFERLIRIGVAYVRFAYRHPAEFRIMFRPELCGLPSTRSPQLTNEAHELLVASVVECQAAGAIAAGPTEPLILAAWSTVHGLSSLLVDGPRPALASTLRAAEIIARNVIEVLATGLRVELPNR